MGGRDVRRYSMEHLRDSCAMVLQKNTLFSGTVRENLLWGNENATQEEIEQACRIACVDEFIDRLANGYDTDLGQGGVNVSGGQKQRLCIARALLKKSQSADFGRFHFRSGHGNRRQNPPRLCHRAEKNHKIIIAQRIASVCDADQIIVMDDGKISAVGKHEDLMESSEIYQRRLFVAAGRREHRWLKWDRENGKPMKNPKTRKNGVPVAALCGAL